MDMKIYQCLHCIQKLFGDEIFSHISNHHRYETRFIEFHNINKDKFPQGTCGFCLEQGRTTKLCAEAICLHVALAHIQKENPNKSKPYHTLSPLEDKPPIECWQQTALKSRPSSMKDTPPKFNFDLDAKNYLQARGKKDIKPCEDTCKQKQDNLKCDQNFQMASNISQEITLITEDGQDFSPKDQETLDKRVTELLKYAGKRPFKTLQGIAGLGLNMDMGKTQNIETPDKIFLVNILTGKHDYSLPVLAALLGYIVTHPNESPASLVDIQKVIIMSYRHGSLLPTSIYIRQGDQFIKHKYDKHHSRNCRIAVPGMNATAIQKTAYKVDCRILHSIQTEKKHYHQGKPFLRWNQNT